MKYLLFFLLLSCSAPDNKRQVISEFSVPTDNLSLIAKQFEVRKSDGSSVLVPQNKIDILYRLEPNAQLKEEDFSSTMPESKAPSYQEIETQLKNLAQKYPSIATFGTYGTSDDNNSLFYLKVTNKSEHFKPAVMLTGATHGDEKIGTDVVLLVMNHILENYGKAQRITDIVNKNIIYFIPVVNADGYIRNERYCAGLDPNRDYPFPEDPNHTSVKTITAIIKFSHDAMIAGSIDMHCCGGQIMYPWAYTRKSVKPDHETRFKDITSKMAKSNGYQTGSVAQVLYVAQGSSADYYYWKNLSWGLGVEVGSSAEENLESTLVYFENYFR